MWQFYLFLGAVAAYDIYELKKSELKRETFIYTVILIVTVVYSIFYYSAELFTSDFYTFFIDKFQG